MQQTPVRLPHTPPRGGSTLLIVVVLLGMLAVLGFLFYTFAAGERSAATYFADANKYYSADFEADTLVEFGLEQLIVGPDPSLTQSALYGGRHSLIPNLFGRDIYTYDSAGIHLGSEDFNPYPNPSGAADGNSPFVDMNYDGVADTVSAATPLGQAPLDFNDSAVAHGGDYPRDLFDDPANTNPVQIMPDSGVDYTYPDINNVFLAYKGFGIDPNGNTVQVIIPSFHRPQLLRHPSSAANPGKPVADWYQNVNFAARVLRPHPSHLNPNGQPRFPQAVTGTLTAIFPFMQGANGNQGVWSRTNRGDTTAYIYEYDVDNDGDSIKEGIWMDLNHPVQTYFDGAVERKYVPLYSFTVYDADGLFNLNVHGNDAHRSQLTQLSDFTSGSLTGYLSGSNQGLTPFEVNPQYTFYTDPANTATFMTPLDPSYARQFGAAPTNVLQAANMEWWRLLAGSANFQSPNTFNDLYAGRYGEANDWLYGAFMQGITSMANAISASPINQMPAPGETLVDDNWNQYEGQFSWDFRSATPGVTLSGNLITYTLSSPKFYPAALQYYADYPYGNPLDFNADGTIVQSGQLGKVRLPTTHSAALYNSMKYQQFVNYDNWNGVTTPLPSDPNTFDSVAAAWRPDSLLGTQMVDRSNNPVIGAPVRTQTDEAHELIADPASASQHDNIFRDDEMAGLHLSKNNRTNLSLSSRVDVLAPLNFKQSNRSEDIRKRFTTSSFDRKQFGLAGMASDTAYKFQLPLPDTMRGAAIDNIYGDSVVFRSWELSDLDGDFKRETFPPAIYDTNSSIYINSTNTVLPTGIKQYDPFRGPMRKLLQSTYESLTPSGDKQLRLSLNHLTTTDANPRNDFQGNVIQRGLTPHYPGLSNAAVIPDSRDFEMPPIPMRPFRPESQEVQARLDRQQMARDIYVMLYMLGGGLDYSTQSGHLGAVTAPANSPNLGYLGSNAPDGAGVRNLYSDRQLREMAQFAVNVVDALDPDHVMTKFEYDKDLGNGWGIYDGNTSTSIVLDDDPYTNEFTAYTTGSPKFDPNYPEDSDQRGVVFGVEVQEMTFSESLVFQCPRMHLPAMTPHDHIATEHDETEVRYHTYLELRNISPKTIDFGFTNCWRIRSVSRNKTLQVYGPQRHVTFLTGQIAPSSILTVGNAGEMDAALVGPDHSRFRCANTNSGGTTVDASDINCWIAPSTVNALDLDLVADRDNLGTYQFRLVDPGPNFDDVYDVSDDSDITNMGAGTDGVGRFFNDTSLHDPTYVSDTSAPQDAKDNSIQEPIFILERRQYPDRPAPTYNDAAQNADNPWVPVDQVTVSQFRRFGLQPSDNVQSQYDTVLRQLLSRERPQALSDGEQDFDLPAASATPPTPPSVVKANSLMLENSRTDVSTGFTDWQPAYDRPFASPGELFQIPLYSPHKKTKWLSNSMLSPMAQSNAAELESAAMIAPIAYAAGQQIGIPTAYSAAGKLLIPQHITNINLAPGSKVPVNDNRWYRLFEFFEVPTRTHRQLGNPLENVRIPGKINLNGVRHAEVLAGLIDDLEILDVIGLGTSQPRLNAKDGETDPSTLNPRDWWLQFLKARDGRRATVTGVNDANSNPIVKMSPDNVTGLFLPGLADSSPFRSFSALGFTQSATFSAPETALDQTLFRRLPMDMENQGSGTGDPNDDPSFNTRHIWEVGTEAEHKNTPIDPVMRDRLLSKIFNNTTTRSHVFYVFVSIQFFEADDTNGPQNVQIGGPIAGNPEYRGFFVIDRSKPEDAYDGVSGRYANYRSMIKYRLRIE